ncbi:Transposase IS116/IS110/IS902 family [Legionella cincinnatiensis]|uniref:Transposase IS116/IS110/IS902 family n=1 Tax=Legionella cincinnatiensis TaxID=28085 RepID=A0A378ILI8_9GAMM|nr:Transposase IS116/IS110/IS902 family [Legionella cincinnatiensis]
MLHRYRERLTHERTALGNRIRGYLREVGLFLVQGLSQVRKQVPLMLEDGENELTNAMRAIISRCPKKLLDLDKDIEKYTQKIEHFCQQSPVCERMMKLSGVGPIIASAVYATMGNPTHFKNGRHFAAFLGLVPKEHSSGGKQCFMSISKRGELHTQFTDTWWPGSCKKFRKKH